MGLFSKIGSAIGNVAKGVGNFFASPTGSLVQSGLGAAAQWYGDKESRKFAKQESEKDRAFQARWNQIAAQQSLRQEQSLIQARVSDARKAGIGRLAGLGLPGASPPNFSATPVGRTGGSSNTASAFNAVNRALTNITLAREKAQLATERAEARKRQKETDNVDLQNKMARTELYRRQMDQIAHEIEAAAESRGPQAAYQEWRNPRTGATWWGPSTGYAEILENFGSLFELGRQNLADELNRMTMPPPGSRPTPRGRRRKYRTPHNPTPMGRRRRTYR